MVVHSIVFSALLYPPGTKIETVKVLSVEVSTAAKEAGVVDVIVPTSVVGNVIVPSVATLKPLKVKF